MSSGAETLVQWTNRAVHLTEGTAHFVHLGGTAGRVAKRLPFLGVITGGLQAGFFCTEAVGAFNEKGRLSSNGWEAVGGSALGGIGAALSLTPWGPKLALAEITIDWLGSMIQMQGRNKFNANQVVGGLLRGSLGQDDNSPIDTRKVYKEFGGGILGTVAQGAVSLAASPLNSVSTVARSLYDWGGDPSRKGNYVTGKFEIYKDKRGEFRFRLKSSNGQNILASEGYKGKSGCTNGIKSVQKNALDDNRYERKETKSGKFMFNLKAGNNQVIGTSESYESAASRDNGITSVMKNATDAAVVDLTAS